MNTTTLLNLLISLAVAGLLSIGYAYLVNRKRNIDRKRMASIALITFGITLALHWFIVHYIYSTTAFTLLLFFLLPFFVCLAVSSRLVLGKKKEE